MKSRSRSRKRRSSKKRYSSRKKSIRRKRTLRRKSSKKKRRANVSLSLIPTQQGRPTLVLGVQQHGDGIPCPPCPRGKICNPATGRCVDMYGPIGEKIRMAYRKIIPAQERQIALIREEENRIKFADPTSTCISRSKLPLRDIQKRVVQYMEANNGLIVVHGTGAGKTLTAVAASQCFLDANPDGRVIFVGPVTLISNFTKELDAYGVTDTYRYDFYSFDKFANDEESGRLGSLNKDMLIIDEAHNLRNAKGRRTLAVVAKAMEAKKRLLLTATPFVNSIKDLIPLINILYGRLIVGSKLEVSKGDAKYWIGDKATPESLKNLRDALRGKVHVVESTKLEELPERIDHYFKTPMSEEFLEHYVKALKRARDNDEQLFANPEAFWNGHRRAVNQAGKGYISEKVQAAIPIVRQGKTLIYTNWVDFGVNPISSVLIHSGIRFEVLSGETSVHERTRIVNDFNNDVFQVLVITRTGAEGLDLKGVRNVIVIEPPWNDASLQQIIGRAVRFRSHAHLPPEERKVDVYFMILTYPKDYKDLVGMHVSGDEIMYKIIEEKNHESIMVNKLLNELSI